MWTKLTKIELPNSLIYAGLALLHASIYLGMDSSNAAGVMAIAYVILAVKAR